MNNCAKRFFDVSRKSLIANHCMQMVPSLRIFEKMMSVSSLKPSPVIKVSNKEFCWVIVLVSVPGSYFVRSNFSFLRLSFSFWSSLWLVLTYLLYNTLHIYFLVYFLIYYPKYYVLYQKPTRSAELLRFL